MPGGVSHANSIRKQRPTNLGLLRAILNPKRHPELGTFMTALEEWEQNVRKYEECSGESVRDDYRCLGLLDLVPISLREHIQLHMARLNTYALMRAEVIAYVETKRQNSSSDQCMPMDIGAMTSSREKKNGKQGEGKSSRCKFCSRPLTAKTHT